MSGERGGPSWFAALPDCAAAAAAAQLLSADADRVVPHASGRPWLVGRWRDDEVALASAGRRQVAVVGACGLPESDLITLVAEASPATATELCRALARSPGAASLVASLDGVVVARGTASATRRVFHATVQGVAVVADRARLLAELSGGGPAPEGAATALLMPSVPYPLDPAALWTGVAPVPPDHFVTVAGAGAATTRRWWQPPAPALSLADGAERLRAALRAAVGLRARDGELISADLSGGVDSTALCFLAAERRPRLVTLRVGVLDKGNDDPEWADRAARQLSVAEHLVADPIEATAAPPGGVADVVTGDGEHPLGGLLSIATLRHTGGLLAAQGSRQHLAGYGGDETVGVSRAYLRDLLRSRPGLVFGHLRAHRVLRRWPWTATLRALADGRSFGRWASDTAAGLRDRQLPGSGPQLGWGATVRLPPWVTPLAADMVRRRLLATTRDATPLAPQRAQHRAVAAVRAAAHNVRQLAGVLEQAGVSLATPYLDDAVVDAAFAVDLAERGNPTRYKPLLAEAMRPILPPEARGRMTKGFFAAEGIDGLRRHRRVLVELCDELRLAELGLVDARALTAALLGPDPSGQISMAVERTIATELWLRAASRSRLCPEKGLV